MSDLHSIDHAQRLYVLSCGKGFTCLGFDIAEKRRRAYLAWLELTYSPAEIGTQGAYLDYVDAVEMVAARHATTGERCPAELTPELIGFEGKRVEVTAPGGFKQRFYVSKSTGWIPVHLAIKTSRSLGGDVVYLPEGAIVRVVGSR